MDDRFLRPAGQDLAAASTYQAKRAAFNDGQRASTTAAWVAAATRRSPPSRSRRSTYDPDGTLRTFHATFEQHCEGATPALRGTWDFKAA